MADEVEEREREEDEHNRLEREFIRNIPKRFYYAAKELEYQRVYLSHARYAITPLGRQALVRELVPTTDIDRIDKSLDEITELRSQIVAGEAPHFDGLADIRSTLRKVEIPGSTIYVEEGNRILGVLQAFRSLREYFLRRQKTAPRLWQSAIHLFDNKLLEMHFRSVYDDAGNVKDSASHDLNRIRKDIVSTAERLRSRLNAILSKLAEDGYVQEDIVTQRDGRFVLPIKTENKRRVPGFIHSVSQTGQTVFIEPSETLELNNELRSLEFAEQREIERILRGLADMMRGSVQPLLVSLDHAAHMEAVYTKARYAEELHSNNAKPQEQVLKRPRKLSIKNARHPLLLQKLGRDKTVPLSLELDEEHRTLILTGPNAGGKTVLLKTVGMVMLMAQAGLPIPADADAELPLMDGIFVEIGDAQSLSEDLSTFSSHIKSIAAIMRSSSRASLILLDEIGGGTAPDEGGALAESILETITTRGTFAIATTHYGRLAAFAEAVPGAVNGSMEFDSKTLTPSFRFRPSIPGSSHAFDIALRYGLAKDIVSRGRSLQGEEGSRLEDLIKSLEVLQNDAQERKKDAERELGKARIARVEFERKRDEVEDVRRTVKQTAAKEAEDILKQANSFVEKAVREAREAARVDQENKSNTSEESRLKELRREQELERKKILGALNKPEPQRESAVSKETIVVGSTVSLISNPEQTGTVLALKPKEAEVQFGTLKMRVKPDQLQISGKSKPQGRQEISVATKFMSEQPQTRIDLRGKYGDDGVMEVERFLGDAAAHGLERVEIIHGIGTGALGKRIAQHLKNHPLVLSYRYGEPQEGGSGVTIVTIK